MKRFKTLVSCGVAAISVMMLAICMVGCSLQQTYYTPPDAAPELSMPAIGTDGILRVGVNTTNPPLSGKPSTSSKIVGLDVDMAAALADSFGLKLEVVDVGPDPESALTEGKVDLVMGVDKSSAPDSFWTSNVYLPTAVALFSMPDNTVAPAADSQSKIAAQISSKSAWAVANEFEQDALVTTEDLEDAFSQLNSKRVSYVAADAIIGMYAAHKAGKEVNIVALMQQPSGYAIGVANSNDALKRAVSDALATLQSDGVISVIESKWLGVSLDLSQITLTEGAKTAASGASSNAASDSSNKTSSNETESNTADISSHNIDASAASESKAGANAVRP